MLKFGFDTKFFGIAGVEILNGAIDSLHSSVPAENWAYVSVTIAPSTITIAEHDVRMYSISVH